MFNQQLRLVLLPLGNARVLHLRQAQMCRGVMNVSGVWQVCRVCDRCVGCVSGVSGVCRVCRVC